MARPKPPPYAELIAAARTAPPRMTITEAARRAGISDTRWSQLENGYRMNRGHAEPEWAPADTLAHMARAVGVTPDELAAKGRADAAAELAALPPDSPVREPVLGGIEELLRRIERIESNLERLTAREPIGKEEGDPNGHEGNGSRRAG